MSRDEPTQRRGGIHRMEAQSPQQAKVAQGQLSLVSQGPPGKKNYIYIGKEEFTQKIYMNT